MYPAEPHGEHVNLNTALPVEHVLNKMLNINNLYVSLHRNCCKGRLLNSHWEFKGT